MKSTHSLFLALALCSASSLAADCEQPTMPELPSGATASMEQMLDGQKAIKAFQSANVEYMQCLEPTLNAAQKAATEGGDGAAKAYEEIEAAYNAAVSAEEEVAGQFNTAIRAYKAANPS